MSEKPLKEGLTALLVSLFAYAGVSILLDYELFRNHLILSPWPLLSYTAPYMAGTLPVIELLIAIMLIMPRTRISGLWMAFMTMLAFTAYVAVFLLSDRKLPCSCSGVFSFMDWEWHLLFNIIFTMLAETALFLHIPLPIDFTSIFKHKKQYLQ
ncbi:MauE/DoxX family redox-associated membrane protein [Chitinophaga pinensis]|uniref:Methylamine utilisation protein MauE domain-containing protein n=1 Tax=Chitinophaga pinensis (strain ATCC 43595 / DSM 2588 / LMG 13176 / NBRC 15968 / NCIMB 11800 / UQM 2034) TaxID=485918 RepID=A0A979G7G7_CHIPD|nr:MauE/DoxX family redox-associated membrane protein [Chitinophaga pinensis]ACU62128.1 hypothetical protein Cpin_4691 [Chitinophaga pinensis DSM 2588]